MGYRPGTVLLYRYDVWHRGAPLAPRAPPRRVLNLALARSDVTHITPWNCRLPLPADGSPPEPGAVAAAAEFGFCRNMCAGAQSNLALWPGSSAPRPNALPPHQVLWRGGRAPPHARAGARRAGRAAARRRGLLDARNAHRRRRALSGHERLVARGVVTQGLSIVLRMRNRFHAEEPKRTQLRAPEPHTRSGPRGQARRVLVDDAYASRTESQRLACRRQKRLDQTRDPRCCAFP